MKIKSYFAATVEDAIQQARQELGSEAMLITSRRAAPEARQLGAYEVVFGIASQQPAPAAPPESRDLRSELQALRSQLDDIKKNLQLNNAARPDQPATEWERWSTELIAADFSPAIARELTNEAASEWESASAAARSLPGDELQRGFLAECIRRRIERSQPFENIGQDSKGIVIFAGPPGAGKTTTLAKIAISECLAKRVSLRIISVDTNRAGGHDKLRTLAGILGAGFTAANTIQEFAQAVEQNRRNNLLLIDTPGFSRAESESLRELALVLNQIDAKEVHLVLPASMRRADLARTIGQFEAFHPDHLLFTKLDETDCIGAILSAAIETAKPLSFFTRGQSIPEDLEPANIDSLIDSLLVHEREGAASAA